MIDYKGTQVNFQNLSVFSTVSWLLKPCIKIEFDQYLVNSIVELLDRRPKAIGFYGGTFNPPHIGHMSVAQAALKEYCDFIVFCPHSFNPHKKEVVPLEEVHKNLKTAIVDCGGENKMAIANKSLTVGIQNEEFIRIVNSLEEAGVSVYVLIGADALTEKYPKFMRVIPHLLAPRKGYDTKSENILQREYHKLLSVDEFRKSMYLKGLSYFFRSGMVNPSGYINYCCSKEYKAQEDYTIEDELLNVGNALLLENEYVVAITSFKKILEFIIGTDSIKEISKGMRYGDINKPILIVRLAFYGLFQCYLNIKEGYLANECITNAAYGSEEFHILHIYGLYQLALNGKGDFEYSIICFKKACDIHPDLLSDCDKAVQRHLERNSYLRSFIEPIMSDWAAYVQSKK